MTKPSPRSPSNSSQSSLPSLVSTPTSLSDDYRLPVFSKFRTPMGSTSKCRDTSSFKNDEEKRLVHQSLPNGRCDGYTLDCSSSQGSSSQKKSSSSTSDRSLNRHFTSRVPLLSKSSREPQVISPVTELQKKNTPEASSVCSNSLEVNQNKRPSRISSFIPVSQSSNKPRAERVQSFLQKTLRHPRSPIHPFDSPKSPIIVEQNLSNNSSKGFKSATKSPISSSFSPHSRIQSFQRNQQRKQAKKKQNFLSKEQATDGYHQLERSNSLDNASSDTPVSSPDHSKNLYLPPFNQYYGDDLLDSSSVGSKSSSSSYPSIGSGSYREAGSTVGDSGIIGIQRPSYDNLDNTYTYYPIASPAPTGASAQHNSPSPSPSTSTTITVTNEVVSVILPKKRFAPKLNVDTSQTLAAVFEEEEEEHSITNDSKVLETDDEEVIFSTEAESVCNNDCPILPLDSSCETPVALFDTPFATYNEVDVPKSFLETERILRRNTEQKNTLNDIQEKTNDSMFKLGRYLAKVSKPVPVAQEDQSSSCSTQHAIVQKDIYSPVGGSIRSRKSKDAMESLRESSCNPKSHIISEKKLYSSLSLPELGRDCVQFSKIFLLLMEPNTKVFELIHLQFPIQTTTIDDILKMIPHNATEKTLGSQSYMGITRPRKRAEPITNLSLLASDISPATTSVHQSEILTAGIVHGEIIVAIPTGCDHRSLVSLGKQILADPKIRGLVGVNDKDEKSKKMKEKKKKTKCKKDTDCESAIQARTVKSKLLERVQARSHLENDNSSNRIVGGRKEKQSSKFSKRVNENVFIPITTKPDSNPFQRYEKEIQRAVVRAAQANSGQDTDSIGDVPVSCGSKVCSGRFSHAMNSVDTLSPQVDALEAFILSREERSSSVTSRESRTTANDTDSSPRDSFAATNTTDDTSLTGSLESSFNSWSRSLDCSISSRYTGSVKSASTARTVRTTKSDSSISQAVELSSSRLRRKRLTHTVLRMIGGIFIFSVVIYMVDSDSGYWSISAHVHRKKLLFVPMGITGFFYFSLTFVFLLKFQRYLINQKIRSRQRRQFKSQPVTVVGSQCPIMQAAFDLCEILTSNNKQFQL